MAITKINDSLATTTKISNLNDMVLELEGLTDQAKFDLNELDQFVTDLGMDRKFLRRQNLGHSLTNYTGWTHVQAETGYSIWKISPTSYTYNTLNKLYFDDKIVTNKGQANTETAGSFDKVYLYNGDSGSGYVDNTTEASTETGTEFSLMNSTNDYIYVGLSTSFSGLKLEFQTRGSKYTLKIEYYDGTSGINDWTELTVKANTLADNTSAFESDGLISWAIPSGWEANTVNSVSKYWVRISTTTTPTTTAKAYYIIPGNSVIGLLALSSTQLIDEEWAWCTYSSAIYITIRNAGQAAYEGDYYIASSSSSTNKQNFFIYNHTISMDYQDSTYVATTLESQLDPALIPFNRSGMSSLNIEDAIMEARSTGLQNIWYTISGDSGSTTANSSTDSLSIIGGTSITTSISGDILTITSSAIATVYGLPLTLSGTQIRFNYDTNDFQLSGSNLQISDGGIHHGGLNGLSDDDHTQYLTTTRADTWLFTKSISALNDVDIQSGVSSGQLLRWDGSRWHNWTANYYTPAGSDVAVTDGGTGKSSWTQYLIPYADTTTSFSQIAIGSLGQVLKSNGAGSAPTFQTLTSVIEFVIDGGGSAITTGIKGDLEIPFDCTITRWTLVGDTTGSISIDIWKSTYANYPPSNGYSLIASGGTVPTITSNTKNQSSTLTNWTTTITAGDMLRFNVDSISTITRCTLSLFVSRQS